MRMVKKIGCVRQQYGTYASEKGTMWSYQNMLSNHRCDSEQVVETAEGKKMNCFKFKYK